MKGPLISHLRVFEILSWEQWEMFEESQVWEWHHQIGVLQRMLPSFLWFHLSQHKTRSQAFLPWSITSSLLLSPLKGLLHTVTKQTEKNRQAQALEIWCYHSRFKSFNDFPMPQDIIQILWQVFQGLGFLFAFPASSLTTFPLTCSRYTELLSVILTNRALSPRPSCSPCPGTDPAQPTSGGQFKLCFYKFWLCEISCHWLPFFSVVTFITFPRWSWSVLQPQFLIWPLPPSRLSRSWQILSTYLENEWMS